MFSKGYRILYRKGRLASLSDVTERKHWLQMGWPEKIGISSNSNYTINWKFFLPYDLLQETLQARILVKMQNNIHLTKIFH